MPIITGNEDEFEEAGTPDALLATETPSMYSVTDVDGT